MLIIFINKHFKYFVRLQYIKLPIQKGNLCKGIDNCLDEAQSVVQVRMLEGPGQQLQDLKIQILNGFD